MSIISNSSKPGTFFALAIGWTCLFLIPAIPLSRDGVTGLVMVLRILAGAGSAVAAIFLLYLRDSRKERRDYWRRLIDFRRIPLAWLGVTLLTVPTVTVLAAVIDQLMGGEGLHLQAAAEFLERPLFIIPFVLYSSSCFLVRSPRSSAGEGTLWISCKRGGVRWPRR